MRRVRVWRVRGVGVIVVGLVGLEKLEGDDVVGAGVVGGSSAGSIGVHVVKDDLVTAGLVSWSFEKAAFLS